MAELSLLQLIPEYRDYVWGGNRLRPMQQTAEAWVIFENNRVASGSRFSGGTLATLTAEYGQALLGRRPFQRTGSRFPLLVKLLDCAQWLSVQVHPNDEQAERLEGQGNCGKTEAWHVLEAEAGATLMAGLMPGTTAEKLELAIRNGTIVELLQACQARQGDTVFIRPGTLHALGPGLLIYEIQQTSDITYRVFDWDRPLTAERTLHVDKSLAVADLSATVTPYPLPTLADGSQAVVAKCPYFTLELLAAENIPIELDTQAESFHALTVIEGQACVTSCGDELTLQAYDSLIVPASCGAYCIHPQGPLRLLKASVE